MAKPAHWPGGYAITNLPVSDGLPAAMRKAHKVVTGGDYKVVIRVRNINNVPHFWLRYERKGN